MCESFCLPDCGRTESATSSRDVSVYPLLHTHPRVLLKDDNQRAFNTLVNIGKNPNVGAVIVAGVGCDQLQAEEIADGIAESGREVVCLTLE
jgi:altronate dehydratase large subunit